MIGRFKRERVIEPEWLDDLPLEQKQASLADIVRINRYLGGHALARRAIAAVAPAPVEPFTLLDVGAASGDMGQILQARFPNALVTSLDHKIEHLLPARLPKVCGDAFQLPFATQAFDYTFCSLFLHHFEDEQVAHLLAEFARVSRRAVVVTDLERHLLAYYFLPATRWLFDWDLITLHDGPISVQAGFRAAELHALAGRAGLRDVRVWTSRPAFRLALIAKPR